MQKMLSTYRREIERLKTENREVRARGSVAERGYRAVMAENERLCNKLEHLEEILFTSPGKRRGLKEKKETLRNKHPKKVKNGKKAGGRLEG